MSRLMLDLIEQQKTDRIPLRIDDDAVRIGDTQVTLDVLVGAYDRGATAEEIAQKFGELELSDIYSVIAYLLRHEDEVRQYLAKRRSEGVKLKQEIEKNPSNQKLRERLVRLKRERADSSGGQ